MIDIIFKTKDFIIVNKPSGVPSQKDTSGSPDAMTLASEALKSSSEPDSLWLVHRLDRAVGGLLVFARTKAAAAVLSALASEYKMEKGYIAVSEGFASGGTMRDFVGKDSISSRAFVTDRAVRGAKSAELSYSRVAHTEGEKTLSLVKIELKTGRFHQIRAQFSSRKMPLVGDKKYGSRDSHGSGIALFAYRLAFSAFGKSYEFFALPDAASYPWSMFDLNDIK